MIRRGEIYFVNLSPVRGREQAGYRPVLVVSSDAINRRPLVVTVMVGTSATNVERKYPTNVHFLPSETGLAAETVFMGFQLRSLDHSRFRSPAGAVPESRMAEVEQAVRSALELR